MSGPETPSPAHIYHERQIRALCALHSLNNLFQAPHFTQGILDELCFKLDKKFVNDHKSFWGIGAYDVNVIQAALVTKGFDLVWFDKRIHPNELDMELIFGFILNVPSRKSSSIFGASPLSSFSSNRHWYAIRDLPSPGELQQGLSHFYNLDSNLEQPRSIGNRLHLVHFLREQINCAEKQIFLVVTPRVSTTGSWRLPFPAAPSMPVFTGRTNHAGVEDNLAVE